MIPPSVKLAILAVAVAIGLALGAGLWIGPGRDNVTAIAIPDIPFETSDGRRMSLDDFRGRFVLLNLWATWCPPCVAEMPSLDRLQARKGSAEFEVLALSIDRKGLEAIGPFYKRTGIANLAIYLDRGAGSMSALKVTGLPTTLLLDPKGREIQRWAGAKEWDDPATIAEIEKRIAQAKSAAR